MKKIIVLFSFLILIGCQVQVVQKKNYIYDDGNLYKSCATTDCEKYGTYKEGCLKWGPSSTCDAEGRSRLAVDLDELCRAENNNPEVELSFSYNNRLYSCEGLLTYLKFNKSSSLKFYEEEE